MYFANNDGLCYMTGSSGRFTDAEPVNGEVCVHRLYTGEVYVGAYNELVYLPENENDISSLRELIPQEYRN
jgi:hypothetical protein